MIDSQDLDKIVTLALCTAYIKGDKPLSLLIISDRPESGKTEVVKQFSGTPGVEFASDVTGFGIKRDFCERIIEGKLHHIIIPEMITPLAKGQVSSDSFTAILQAIIEDGVMGLHTGFLKASWSTDMPVRSVGVIGCLPRPFLTAKLKYDWMKRGFLSRFLVVSYKYADDTLDEIFGSIEQGDYLGTDRQPIDFDGNEVAIELPKPVAVACTQLGKGIVEEAVKAGLAYGFREVKHIRALVAANVILERIDEGTDRTEATMADFEEVDRLGYLFNQQFNALKGGE